MKTYQIRVTQDLRGWYNGYINIDADSSEEALKILKELPLDVIDDIADWTQGNEYYGDISSIEIDETSVTEI